MTDTVLTFVYAFAIGGFLCMIAQILIDKTKLTPARILVSYVVGGVFLTAVGIYEPLVDFAGNGATTPLTGFGFSLAKGVEKAVDENGLIGALTGGLTGTAGGITAAMLFGLLAAVFFKSKPK
jgi:stage V sporulation protein AE